MFKEDKQAYPLIGHTLAKRNLNDKVIKIKIATTGQILKTNYEDDKDRGYLA